MKPFCLSITAALALVAAAAGLGPPREGLWKGPDQPVPTQTVIKMTLHPVGPSEPALRYKLLPEVRDREPGNAAVLYLRSFSPEWYIGSQASRIKDFDTNAEKWRHETPLKELPLKELQWVIDSNSLKEVDRAARRSYCDWELTPRLRAEGIGTLLPDVQSFRQTVRFLMLRARAQLAQGKLGDAMYTLQTSLGMSRDLATGPTLIHALVAIALGTIALERLEEVIQQPGAPNFYWPLTDLPRPFISLRPGMEGERLVLDWMFPGGRALLHDPTAPRPSLEKLRETVQMIRKLAEDEPKDTGPVAEMIKRSFDDKAATLPEARAALKLYGWTDAQIDTLPGPLANSLLEIHNYDRYYDEMVKLYTLPYPMVKPAVAAVEARLKEEKQRFQAGVLLAGMLLPATNKVIDAARRIDRRVSLIRAVEAVRLYAAKHGGKLPEKLADVTEVPVPDDPATGKPFGYALEGDKAVLTAPTPPGETPNQAINLRYELTIAR
jgi:hypothetical protein